MLLPPPRSTLFPYTTLFRSAASEDVDLIVGAGVQIAGASIAEWRDVPYCSVAFCPCAIPSRNAPPPSVKTQTLPKWVNGLLWQAGRPVTDLLLRKSINTGRARLALEPIDSVLEHFAGSAIIVAADRDLAPMGDDAPAVAVQTDAWIDRVSSSLDSRVEVFLRLAPPPIYIGFGSMVASDVAALARDAIIAARALGRRAIVAGGWAGLNRYLPDDEDVCVVEAAPHDLVLPHVAAAVHHGGAGTTTAAARAGRLRRARRCRRSTICRRKRCSESRPISACIEERSRWSSTSRATAATRRNIRDSRSCIAICRRKDSPCWDFPATISASRNPARRRKLRTFAGAPMTSRSRCSPRCRRWRERVSHRSTDFLESREISRRGISRNTSSEKTATSWRFFQ